MAVLSDNDRATVWAEYMREISALGEICPLTKTQLREVFNAADQWAEDNAASFNSAIPQPARGLLSARAKARVLARVVELRYKVS